MGAWHWTGRAQASCAPAAAFGDIIRSVKNETFERSISLLGDDAFRRISELSVTVFGVGGVGGWCAEALVRTGVRKITLVDDDVVAASNTNRQRQATPCTIGHLKVEVLREILQGISPESEIKSISERYTPETAGHFDDILAKADFVIDAIDSVDCKAHLIQRCVGDAANGGPTIFSSMGAALRTDSTKVRISRFDKIAGDGLARALRNRFRKHGQPIPRHMCVHSDELPARNLTGIKGSLMPVTCTFGMALAHLVISSCANGCSPTQQ